MRDERLSVNKLDDRAGNSAMYRADAVNRRSRRDLPRLMDPIETAAISPPPMPAWWNPPHQENHIALKTDNLAMAP
jgi:hypothetical protein